MMKHEKNQIVTKEYRYFSKKLLLQSYNKNNGYEVLQHQDK